MDPYTLLLAALFIGVRAATQYMGQKNTAAIKARQQAFRREQQERGFARDWESFARCCEEDEKIEAEAHRQREDDLDRALLNVFQQKSHTWTLDKGYPLLITPYVLNRAVAPLSPESLSRRRREVLCLVTASDDAAFNAAVVPLFDRALCHLVARVWNMSSRYTVCCFPGTWNPAARYSPALMDNLRSVLTTPTVAISPRLAHSAPGEPWRLSVTISAWGMGQELSEDLPTGIEFPELPSRYSAGDSRDIVSAVLPATALALGHVVDAHYWDTERLPPLLPALLARGELSADAAALRGCALMCRAQYTAVALGDTTDMAGLAAEASGHPVEPLSEADRSAVSDIASRALFAHPERAVAYLEALLELAPGAGHSVTAFSRAEADALVLRTLLAFCRERTGQEARTVADVATALLDSDDMALVARLLRLARRHAATASARDATALYTAMLKEPLRG